MVKRFDLDRLGYEYYDMMESISGDYVDYADYDALCGEYDTLKDKYDELVKKLGEIYQEA